MMEQKYEDICVTATDNYVRRFIKMFSDILSMKISLVSPPYAYSPVHLLHFKKYFH